MNQDRFDDLTRKVAANIERRSSSDPASAPESSEIASPGLQGWHLIAVFVGLLVLAVAFHPGSEKPARSITNALTATTGTVADVPTVTSGTFAAAQPSATARRDGSAAYSLTYAPTEPTFNAGYKSGNAAAASSSVDCPFAGCRIPSSGYCGSNQYSVFQTSTGSYSYSAPSSMRSSGAAIFCADSPANLPKSYTNADDPIGWCDRDPAGCVSGSGGPCANGERGCVPYDKASPLDKCNLRGQCASDPRDPNGSTSGGFPNVDANPGSSSSCILNASSCGSTSPSVGGGSSGSGSSNCILNPSACGGSSGSYGGGSGSSSCILNPASCAGSGYPYGGSSGYDPYGGSNPGGYDPNDSSSGSRSCPAGAIFC